MIHKLHSYAMMQTLVFPEQPNNFREYNFLLPTHTHTYAYVGTTERIFESKTHLYDVYIDNQTILPTSNRLDCFLRLTPTDEQRYTQLIHSQ